MKTLYTRFSKTCHRTVNLEAERPLPRSSLDLFDEFDGQTGGDQEHEQLQNMSYVAPTAATICKTGFIWFGMSVWPGQTNAIQREICETGCRHTNTIQAGFCNLQNWSSMVAEPYKTCFANAKTI
jgi:hypothetical protein